MRVETGQASSHNMTTTILLLYSMHWLYAHILTLALSVEHIKITIGTRKETRTVRLAFVA